MSDSPDRLAASRSGTDCDDCWLAALTWAWSPPEIETDGPRDEQPQDWGDRYLEPGDGEAECREHAISDPQGDLQR
jgi:hypothetical protein